MNINYTNRLSDVEINSINEYLGKSVNVDNELVSEFRKFNSHLKNNFKENDRVPVIVRLLNLTTTKQGCSIRDDGLGIQFWNDKMLQNLWHSCDGNSASVFIARL